MNYRALFRDKTTLEGSNFTCSLFRGGGLVPQASKERYPVLFLLRGSLEVFCEEGVRTVYDSEMIIMDRSRVSQIKCLSNTILMEYRLPAALTARFPTFHKSLTPPVPITGRLEVWVEECLMQKPAPASGVLSEGDNLVDLLILYQVRRMQMLIDALRNYAAESGFLRQLKPRR